MTGPCFTLYAQQFLLLFFRAVKFQTADCPIFAFEHFYVNFNERLAYELAIDNSSASTSFDMRFNSL